MVDATPVQAPVIIEDDCFIGSRAIVVEGAHICRESVLGAGVVITGSTHIIDVTEAEPKQYKGYVPVGSVVIPGSYPKRFPAGEYGVPCALIIGRRKGKLMLIFNPCLFFQEKIELDGQARVGGLQLPDHERHVLVDVWQRSTDTDRRMKKF